MLAGQALDAGIAGVALVAVRGTWWRAVGRHLLGGPPPGAPAGSPPQPLWPLGSSRFGARFTPKGGPATVYLASDAQTALLEVGVRMRTMRKRFRRRMARLRLLPNVLPLRVIVTIPTAIETLRAAV